MQLVPFVTPSRSSWICLCLMLPVMRQRGLLNELREVHSTFLKGVFDTVEEMALRFAC
jgi:hypothetical protein